MSEIAPPMDRASETPPDQIARRLPRALALRLPLTRETFAYAVLFVAAFGLRFWDLGSRALHHDESLHAYYSYQLFQGNGYEHSPLLHGPFQFFGMALTFFLAGGASDYTARVFPAVFGTALVVLPLLFRNHLGRTGALAAAALIAFSPTLLYYSRFAREDIYAAVFTLGLVICLWRYIAERKPQYLYGAAALLALAFATKETTFITAAILLLFLDMWVAADLARQTREKLGDREPAYPFYFLAYLPFAWAVAALWPFIGGLRQRFGITERHPAIDVLVVFGALAGPQFAAAIQVPLGAAGIDIDSTAASRAVGFPTVVGLVAASSAVGLAWDHRRWPVIVACFYIPYVLLFTSFFTDIRGLGGGAWESLDYWMGQHGEHRGDQPGFYYLMFFPMYEYLALAFAGPALLWYTLRGGWRSWLLTTITIIALLAFFGADSFGGGTAVEIVSAAMLPVAAVTLFFAVRGTDFERFLVFWTVASLVVYSFVGERMPWLSVHTTLPAVLLAAYAMGNVLSHLEPTGRSQAFSYARLAAIPGGAAIAAGAGIFGPANGAWLALRVAVVAIALAGLLALVAVRVPRRQVAALVPLAALGVLAMLSLRTGVLAVYGHGDVSREFLFYTQTSPDVPDVVAQIDRLAVTSGMGDDLQIQVDRAYAWPWAWYLREYETSFETIDAAFRPEPGALLLVAGPDDLFTVTYRDNYEAARPYVLRWWFPEGYRSAGQKANLAEGLGDFLASMRHGSTWEGWWDYFLHRDVTPRGIEGRLYVPLEYGQADLAPTPGPDVAEPTARPTADLEGRVIIGSIGTEAGHLSGPVGLALDAAGNIYVMDSGNSRVQVFDGRGASTGVAGSPGGEAGQFNQPSDVAIGPGGSIYVADTWNHRIEKLGPDLAFVAAFGRPTRDLINPGPDEMWGPRGIAVDGEGNVWVTDAGTNRVRKFGPDGTVIASFGSRGKGPGQFIEPVGIALGPDGSVYVADAGNARIQKFAPDLSFVAEFPIAAWADRDPRNKPYLEALPDGRLLATDGPHGRVLLVGQDGAVQASVDSVGEAPFFFPAGVAFDAARGFVYVTDGAAGHVARFPLTDFALR